MDQNMPPAAVFILVGKYGAEPIPTIGTRPSTRTISNLSLKILAVYAEKKYITIYRAIY